MLKQRVITGLVLLAIALIILLMLPSPWFRLFTSVIMMLCAWEWSSLSSVTNKHIKIAYTGLMMLGMLGSTFIPLIPLLVVTAVWWVIAALLVVRYPSSKKCWSSSWVRLLIGFLVLIPCWLSLNVLRASENGLALLLFLLFLVWAADVGAYFAGRWWGKAKLMPKVSPGKTWQGFFGGLVLSLLIAVIGLVWLQVNFVQSASVFITVVLLNIFSVVGDLFESMLKRYCDLKDSGTLLPGHGGILDRIDSLTAAAPLFLLGFMLHWVF